MTTLSRSAIENDVTDRFELGPSTPGHDFALRWAAENIANPFFNAAYVDTVNGFTGTASDLIGNSPTRLDLGRFKVGDSDDTVNLIAQTVAGSVGTMVKYVIAGKLASVSLRSIGSALEVEGKLGRAMRNDTVAQLAGAGTLSIAEKPKEGETRPGNFTSTMFTFGVFEGASALSRSMAEPIKQLFRFSAGGISGAGQQAASDYLADREITSANLMKSGLSGGVAGWSVPLLQSLGTRGINSFSHALGRGIAIDRYALANFQAESQQAPIFQRLREKNSWARIQDRAKASYADADRNMVFLAASESTTKKALPKITHELGHLEAARTARYEESFVSLAKTLQTAPETANLLEQFRALRAEQEVDQLQIEHETAKQLGLTDTAFDAATLKATLIDKIAFGNTTYGTLWNQEFEQFKQSGGRFRPAIEYGGSDETTPEKELRELGTKVAKDLQDAGQIAVFAGGSVRDELLGFKPKDYDIATSATPEQVKQIFTDKGIRVFPKGESFGVMSVVIDGKEFEIATLRNDGDYSDGRRPDSVVFVTSLIDDAARRDLTINAMFKDPVTGKLYDFFGGKSDIDNRILRAVGDADVRFAEDRLRMLRVARFKARLGDFTVAPELIESIKKHAPLIKGNEQYKAVSKERIQTELKGIVLPNGASDGIRLLKDTGLLEQILPDMMPTIGPKGAQDPRYHPEGPVFVHSLMVLDNMAGGTFEEKLAGLVHDIGKPRTQVIRPNGRITNFGHDAVGAKMTEAIMTDLKFSSKEVTATSDLVRNHMVMHDVEVLTKTKLARLLERPDIMSLIKLQKADALGTTAPDRFAKVKESFILGKLADLRAAEVPAQRLGAPPVVTGEHLVELGYVPGPAFKMILEAARVSQYEGGITSPETGINFVREKFGRYQGLKLTQQKELLTTEQAAQERRNETQSSKATAVTSHEQPRQVRP